MIVACTFDPLMESRPLVDPLVQFTYKWSRSYFITLLRSRSKFFTWWNFLSFLWANLLQGMLFDLADVAQTCELVGHLYAHKMGMFIFC